jgi:hypothetical protein
MISREPMIDCLSAHCQNNDELVSYGLGLFHPIKVADIHLFSIVADCTLK